MCKTADDKAAIKEKVAYASVVVTAMPIAVSTGRVVTKFIPSPVDDLALEAAAILAVITGAATFDSVFGNKNDIITDNMLAYSRHMQDLYDALNEIGGTKSYSEEDSEEDTGTRPQADVPEGVNPDVIPWDEVPVGSVNWPVINEEGEIIGYVTPEDDGPIHSGDYTDLIEPK